jgi:hypothetical protein
VSLSGGGSAEALSRANAEFGVLLDLLSRAVLR